MNCNRFTLVGTAQPASPFVHVVPPDAQPQLPETQLADYADVPAECLHSKSDREPNRRADEEDYATDTDETEVTLLPPNCIIPFRTGWAAAQGLRPTMEDEHVVLQEFRALDGADNDIPDTSYAYFAVFDGHGGAEAAVWAAKHMHVNLARNMGHCGRGRANLKRALTRAFLQTDDSFLHQPACGAASRTAACSGSTAIVAVLVGRVLYVAGAGDSRAVLCLADGRAATLSRDHKPTHPDERQRIEIQGGFVHHDRVNGSLAMSRALGDARYKTDGVIAEPDVFRYRIGPDAVALVLACDGLWDYVPCGEVARRTVGMLRSGAAPELVARSLVGAAIEEYHSTDNVTVVVVAFERLDGTRAAAA